MFVLTNEYVKKIIKLLHPYHCKLMYKKEYLNCV